MFQKGLSPICRLLKKNLQLHCSGLENIKKNSNYIFAMNHQSIADVPIAFSLLVPITDRELNLFLSHKFYDFFWWLASPLKMIRIIMDARSESEHKYNINQLEKGVEKLKKGNNVLIYPEGIIHGGLKNQVINGKTGVIRLAIKAKKTIIPIGIRGSNHVYPFLLKTNNPFIIEPDHPIYITVGPEINLEKYYYLDSDHHSEADRLVIRSLTNELMKTLAEVSGLPCN